MTAESVFDQIREALNGRPGQPIVLGVCQALAERYQKEVGVQRSWGRLVERPRQTTQYMPVLGLEIFGLG